MSLEETFKITCEYGLASITKMKEENGIYDYKFIFTSDGNEIVKPIHIKFNIPCVDIFSIWSPTCMLERNLKPDWRCIKNNSRTASGAPVESVISQKGINRLTIAISDAKLPITIYGGVYEEESIVNFDIVFFTVPTEKRKSYEAIVRFDTRAIPFYTVIQDVNSWWETFYPPAFVPDEAKCPVYSTWYNYHELVSCEALMWIKVGDECYYDASNGIMRSRTSIHKVSIPMEKLDAEKKYIVCYRKIIERKPYFTETEDVIEIPFEFKPVPEDNIRAYHISDTHNRVHEPIDAARTYEENFGKIDFLIMNGDIPHHSGSIENFDVIYQIAEELTKGNIPIVFSRGNHDTRGIYAENIADYTPCQNGNSFYTFRLGDIWGIILDCGEDKGDSHEEYGHTICCHDFRKKETKYIKEVIASNEKEYNEEGIRHKVVIVHNPFTRCFNPPFNIEEEIYKEWAKLLKEKVKPDVMMCGHKHIFAINKQGDEEDKLGQPCTVVVGSHLKDNYYGGCGYEFNADGITATFTDNEGKVLKREKI